MRNQTIHIRRATVEDAELLSKLGNETWSNTTIIDKCREGMDTYSESGYLLARQLAEHLLNPVSIFLIAEFNKKPVGFAQMHDGEVLQCITGSNSLEIERFYIYESWAGKGVSLHLMLACLSYARLYGFETVWLKAWKHNEQARVFYSVWNYSDVGVYYFKIGENIFADEQEPEQPVYLTNRYFFPADTSEDRTYDRRILLR